MSRVVCRNLTKRFGDSIAVDAINLEVEEGEFLVIVGPSGCGKTTTLRMIAGLESVSSGEILIDEEVVNQVEPRHRDIAMVFQNYALYPHKKVFDNIAYPLQLRRVPKAQIRQRVTETANLLGIERLLERRIRQLSGGERQRVALGRAIVREPRLFLMDEPLSNLDAQLRVQMRREIIRLQRQLAITTVYVTHDQVEAMTMGDRIVIMRNGLVQQVGDPVSIYNHPANRFVARFIGSPPMNLFDGVLEASEGKMQLRTSFAEYWLPAELTQRLVDSQGQTGATKVVCGIRAEDIMLDSTLPASENGSRTSSTPVLQGKVDLLESLGSDLFVSLDVGQEMLLARAPADAQLQEGEFYPATLSLAKIHLFDTDGEQSLLRRHGR